MQRAARYGEKLRIRLRYSRREGQLFLDTFSLERSDGSLHFRRAKAHPSAELTEPTVTLARRIGRSLKRQGLLERDEENNYLAGDCGKAPIAHPEWQRSIRSENALPRWVAKSRVLSARA